MASNNQGASDPSVARDEQQQQQQGTLQRTICEHDEDEQDIDPNKQRQIELEEEKKLKAKHPCIQRPGSEFLQKRLQRGQKYFDSGYRRMSMVLHKAKDKVTTTMLLTLVISTMMTKVQ